MFIIFHGNRIWRFRDEMLLYFNRTCRYVVPSSPRYQTITLIVHNTGMAKTDIIKETVEDSINTPLDRHPLQTNVTENPRDKQERTKTKMSNTDPTKHR
jgi:predicted DNA-binding protein